MLIRLVQFVWHICISDPITLVWYVKVDIKLLQFCRGYFQKTLPFVHMYFYSNFTEVFSKVSFVPIEITFTCTKYCLTQWISKLPWVSQNLINLTSGGHIKRNCLRDRANYRSSRAWQIVTRQPMMTSSNRNIFRVTGSLCGKVTGHPWIPLQKRATRRFDVFFDLRLIKRLSKRSWGWWFETPLRPLWRQCDAFLGYPPGILSCCQICTTHSKIGHA